MRVNVIFTSTSPIQYLNFSPPGFTLFHSIRKPHRQRSMSYLRPIFYTSRCEYKSFLNFPCTVSLNHNKMNKTGSNWTSHDTEQLMRVSFQSHFLQTLTFSAWIDGKTASTQLHLTSKRYISTKWDKARTCLSPCFCLWSNSTDFSLIFTHLFISRSHSYLNRSCHKVCISHNIDLEIRHYNSWL